MSHQNFDLIKLDDGRIFFYVSGKYYHLNNGKAESRAMTGLKAVRAGSKVSMEVVGNIKNVIEDLVSVEDSHHAPLSYSDAYLSKLAEGTTDDYVPF